MPSREQITQKHIEQALGDPEIFSDVFNNVDTLQYVVGKFSEQKNELAACIVGNAAVRVQLIKSVNDLVEVCELFPARRMELSRLVLKNSTERRQLIKNCPDLARFCKKFYESQAEIIQIIIADPIEYKQLIKSFENLIVMMLTCPDQAAVLLGRVLQNPDHRALLFKNVNDMIDFGAAFPGYVSALLTPVLTDSSERARLFDASSDFERLCIAFPLYQVALLNSMLQNPEEFVELSWARWDLNRLCGMFPAHQTEILGAFWSTPALRRRVITNLSDWLLFYNLYPTYQATLVEFIFKNQDEFLRLIASLNNVEKLIKAMPKHKDQIFAYICLIGLEKFAAFDTLVKLNKLIDLFPEHKTEIFNSLYANHAALTTLLASDNHAIDELRNIFPTEKYKLMDFAASCIPLELDSLLRSLARATAAQDVYLTSIEELEETEVDKANARTELTRFEQAFVRSNKMLTAHQRRDFNVYFEEYSESILNLIIIMGPARAFAFLAAMADKSVRYLEDFNIAHHEIRSLELIEFVNFFSKKFAPSLADKKTIYVWKEVILILSALDEADAFNLASSDDSSDVELLKDEYIDQIKKIRSEMQTASLTEILQKLSEFTKSISLELLGLQITDDELDQAKFTALTGSRFWNQLIIGRRKLSNYHDWYAAMLACDITQRSLDALLHDTKQKDASTRVIANHNASIRVELKAAGINPDKATRSNLSHRFAFSQLIKRTDVDWKGLALDIKLTLQNLKSGIASSELQNDKNVTSLSNQIDKLLVQLTKGIKNDDQLIARIQTPLISELIAKLEAKLPHHRERLKSSPAGAELLKLIAPLDVLIAKFNSCKPQVSTTNFRAEMWDKTRPDTFLLGNYLDCCLASDGAEPQAIIERRLDDAMPIHVVIDEETDEPVCALWLFWAQDVKDKKMKLVANFVEMANSYSKHRILRETLLANLLYFTGDLYAKDVAMYPTKIPQLVMRYLSYGNIPDFASFVKVDCQFTYKLGGYCPREDRTPTNYFLDGLKHFKFHLYSTERLRKEFPNSIVTQSEVAPGSVKETLFGDRAKKSEEVQPVSVSSFTNNNSD